MKIFNTAMALIAVVAAGVGNPAYGGVVINEVMQSNIDGIFVDHEFPDSWVELYNPDEEPVSLDGYAIGVKENVSKGWKFPEGTTVQPGAWLLVYCDKADTGMHADFRVDSGKSSVYLFAPDGKIVDRVDLGKMPAPDISYGRVGDGMEKWGYYVSATPGATNAGITSDEMLPEPEFSMAGGVFDSPLTLTIAIPAGVSGDITLCVTTDGREPQASDVVEAPWNKEISESTPVRARLISANRLSPRSTTHTYLLPGRDISLPIVCLTGDPDYFYSDAEGILAGDPADPDANFQHDWRRPVNVELYFGDEHVQVINQLSETRVKGGATRVCPHKSMVLYANKRFGIKRFDTTDIFPHKPHVTECKSIELRNAGNDWYGALMSDLFCQTYAGPLLPGTDFQDGRAAVIFINGEYKGLRNIRERANEDYIEANYDGLEDIDMLEDGNEVKAGDDVEYNAMLDRIHDNPDLTLEEYARDIDVDGIVNFMALSTLMDHWDCIPNNIVMYRRTTGDDRRWKMVWKDLDLTFGRPDRPFDSDFIRFIKNRRDKKQRASRPWTFILDNYDATMLFLDRTAFLLGDILHPSRTEPYFESLAETIRPEVEHSYKVDNAPGDAYYRTNHWNVSVAPDGKYRRWLRERIDICYGQLESHGRIGKMYDLKISTGDDRATLNGYRLAFGEFDGKYFSGRTLVLRSVDCHHWIADITDADGITTTVRYEPGDVYFRPAAGTTAVRFYLGEAVGVDEVIGAETSDKESYYTVDGMRLPGEPDTPGIYIVRKGGKSYKIAVAG